MKITWKIIVLTLIVRLVGQRLVFKQPHMFGHRYHVIFLLLVSFLFLHIFSANKQTRQRNKREREREIILSYRNIVSATLNHTHTQTHKHTVYTLLLLLQGWASKSNEPKKKKKLTKKNHWHSRESRNSTNLEAKGNNSGWVLNSKEQMIPKYIDALIDRKRELATTKLLEAYIYIYIWPINKKWYVYKILCFIKLILYIINI